MSKAMEYNNEHKSLNDIKVSEWRDLPSDQKKSLVDTYLSALDIFEKGRKQ